MAMARTSKRGASRWGAAALIGGGLLALLLTLRGSTRRALGIDPGTGGHLPIDLALDKRHPGPGDRAPEAFRPNMDSPIAAEERGAFAPATMAPAGGATVG